MHSPKLHLRWGVGVDKYLLFTLYLSLLRLMNCFIILHYFIIYLGETLRSLHTLMSCPVDNTGVSNSNLAHGVYNTEVCIIN